MNGFLCFPVSFTITKVNGDCLCLKIGHSGEIPDKYLPRSEYVSEIGTRKKGTTLSESRKMGVVQLTTVTAINMMGSGIILLPATLSRKSVRFPFSPGFLPLSALLFLPTLLPNAVCTAKGRRHGRLCGIPVRPSWKLPFQLHLRHFPDYRQRSYRYRCSQLRFLRFRF